MDYLILLDRKFPYRTGESFLENEINEIAGFFDRVLIYPSDPLLGEEQTRRIDSPNVEVRVTNGAKRRSRAASVVKALGHLSSSSEKGTRKLLDAYCIAEAAALEERIAVDLEREHIGKDDTVYVYSYWLYNTAIAACMLKSRLNLRGITSSAVSRAHRFDIYEEKRPLSFLPQRKWLLSNLDRVYACSADGAQFIRSKYSTYADKVSVSYLGTYDHGLSAPPSSGRFRVVSCSRVVKVKRVDAIAEALALLEESGLELEWTHIGGGELFDDLRSATERLSWMKVNLLGAVPNSAVYDHYKTHGGDLFVNMSESEGLPVSIMEAISFGIPVTATAVGGTPEIVVDGVSGTLLDKDCTPEKLASVIRGYATMSAGDFANLRASARGLWKERYRAKENYRAFAESVKSLAGSTMNIFEEVEPHAVEQPLVSVVVPAKNAADTLGSTLSSLLGQSYGNLEVLVIDDGSTDDTRSLLSLVNDSRLKVFDGGGKGVSHARNVGIENASGDYLMFIDADDKLCDGAVESAVNLILKHACDIVVGGMSKVWPDGRRTDFRIRADSEVIYQNEQIGCVIEATVGYSSSKDPRLDNSHLTGCWCRLIRRRQLGRLRFNESLPIGEDTLFNVTFLKSCQKVVITPDIWYLYRQSASSAVYRYRPSAFHDGSELIAALIREVGDCYPTALRKRVLLQLEGAIRQRTAPGCPEKSISEKASVIQRSLLEGHWRSLLASDEEAREMGARHRVFCFLARHDMTRTLCHFVGFERAIRERRFSK